MFQVDNCNRFAESTWSIFCINNPHSFRMRATRPTHSSLHLSKGKMQDPPKGTQKEFASTMKASPSKGLKGKAIKHSLPGIGRPTSTKSELSKVPKMSPSIACNDAEECTTLTKSPLHIPAVPVLVTTTCHPCIKWYAPPWTMW